MIRKAPLLLLLSLFGLALAHASDNSSLQAASAAEAQGKFATAVTLYNQIIARDPGNIEAYRGRGFSLFALQKFTAAAADFGHTLDQRPNDAYAMIWRYLSEVRAGVAAINELKTRAKLLHTPAWPLPAIRYLSRETNGISMFEAVGTRHGPEHAARLCDAQLFYGENLLLKSRARVAMLAFYLAVSKDCVHNLSTRALARLEYHRLNKAGVHMAPWE